MHGKCVVVPSTLREPEYKGHDVSADGASLNALTHEFLRGFQTVLYTSLPLSVQKNSLAMDAFFTITPAVPAEVSSPSERDLVNYEDTGSGSSHGSCIIA